jgi:hypothetical protein
VSAKVLSFPQTPSAPDWKPKSEQRRLELLMLLEGCSRNRKTIAKHMKELREVDRELVAERNRLLDELKQYAGSIASTGAILFAVAEVAIMVHDVGMMRG